MKNVMNIQEVYESIVGGRISSFVLAEGLNKKHPHIMALIATYKEPLETLAALEEQSEESAISRFEQSIGEKLSYKIKDKSIPYMLLTYDQALFIANLQPSTPFIRDFVAKLIFAFNKTNKAQA